MRPQCCRSPLASAPLAVFLATALLLVPARARAERARTARAADVPPVLTLRQAIAIAVARHPSVAAARYTARAQAHRERHTLSGYLPALSYNFTYTRRTANCVQAPAGFPCSILNQDPSRPGPFDTFNFWNTGITLNQTLFDFGRTTHTHRAAVAGLQASREQLHWARLNVVLEVKVAYYGVLAQQALVTVAEETLAQQKKHLDQAKGFFQVGARTKIDVAQAEANVANAEVMLIRARNNLGVAKLNLLVAMGTRARHISFRVDPQRTPPLPEESIGAPPSAAGGASAALAGEPSGEVPEEVVRAAGQRADVRALEAQARQQEEITKVTWGNYFPVLGLQLGPTWAGTDFARLSGNFFLTLNLTPSVLFNPWVTYHQVAEQRALAQAAREQVEKLRNEATVEVEGARLTLLAAKQAVLASERALVAARERQRLAEGRYQTGVGNIIELSDAQAGLTQARATRVQADYDVDVARARLARALGRE